jgi:NAD(P)-dependent dehydrogenase (short-subunit alcohol dehydrogenase family)
MPGTSNPRKAHPIALITGAGSGIGRAVAVMLARHGWGLGLVGRCRERLDETAELCREQGSDAPAAVLSADLADAASPARIMAWVDSTFGRLDCLVNNAGTGELRPIAETTMELLQRTFAVNAFAPALLIAAAWPIFQRQSREEPRANSPSIVNVSTLGTSDPFPGLSVYAASKSALESYVRSLHNEGGRLGIRAFAVAPGAVETPLLRSVFDEAVIARDRTLKPDDVAQVIVDCILGRRDAEAGRTIRIPSQ